MTAFEGDKGVKEGPPIRDHGGFAPYCSWGTVLSVISLNWIASASAW